jgi:antitoxin MazE
VIAGYPRRVYWISGLEAAMKVQVAKWGNSTAVRLPRAIVKQLGLAQGMTLEVSVDGGVVKLAPTQAQTVRELNGMPEPVTLEWIVSEIKRLGPENEPDDGWDWGPDVGSEVIYDDYNPRKQGS